jgi:cation-transporting ATPase 13A1
MSSPSSSTLRFAQECDSKRIEAVGVYKAKLATGTQKHKLRLYNAVFLLLYVYQSVRVITTIGQPYREFLEKADREGFQVMEGSTRLRAELERSLEDLNDPNRRVQKIGWTDWMDMDIEELAAEKKREKEKNVLDSLPKSMRVPNQYSASFWPTLLLGLLVTLHALVLLMQHWSVSFDVWINYQELNAEELSIPSEMLEIDLDDVELLVSNSSSPKTSADGKPILASRQIHTVPVHLPTHVRVVPAKGKHVLVPVEYYPTLGMTFEYHRRRYVYDTTHNVWSKIRCKVDFDVSVLESWKGFTTPHRLVTGQIRYGPNLFQVKQPNFLDLYKAQLLNPFSVFQIFCVLLWAIDDYLIYSFFSLFMVLMFEGTVVFQRLKSMQMLQGMGNPSRLVYVFRSGRWTQVDSSGLLPGDIMSLTRVQPHRAKKTEENGGTKRPPTVIEDDGGDVVPADLLLLRGSTVVNEASLTGESVPQMKEGMVELEANEHLSMKNKHKMNVAYAGTKMLLCQGVPLDDTTSDVYRHYSQIPSPPDQGCVCFVLRTGFASAQGKLVRMIEGSQEKVKGHERETGLLLLLLCVFAVASSAYVLYHGVQDENRSKYELLLHCILIITSVIRPELPMQMAMAVNNSLMTLMKMHVFCTEPYRVPMAGKLDSCLFDKTGTLTTDELVAVGVCEPHKLAIPKGKEEDADQHFLTPMSKLLNEAGLVLAGCHSLVVYDDETTGDPLEKASLTSMRWHLSTSSGHAVPAPEKGKRAAGKPIVLRSSGAQISEVEILCRHHFSSKLQRMSCVVRANSKQYSVAKGSPEAVGRLLASKPDGYDRQSEFLAKQGYRVIALAFKPLVSNTDVQNATETRAMCESDLIFAGFIAFTCMVRKDTASVLLRLKEGGMSVAMVTGDALLTAIHVAKEVSICEPIEGMNLEVDPLEEEKNEELRAFLDQRRRDKGIVKQKNSQLSKSYRPIAYLELTETGNLFWRSYDDGSKVCEFIADEIPSLSKGYDLATTGACLAAALEQDKEMSKVLEYIKVFARMTPDAKETVIECLHSVNALCLMCGDGANDVGALKQADVGVALLSGFGNLNVEKADEGETKKEENKGATAIISQEHLNQIRSMPVMLIKAKIRTLGADPDKYPDIVEKNDLVQLYQIKAREYAVKQHDEKNAKDRTKMTKAELQAEKRKEMAEKQQRMQARVVELEAQGVQWAQFRAMKEFWKDEVENSKKVKKARGVEGSAATLASQFEDLDAGDIPMVKLGDASIAAPFTSKMPSIRSCVDIVRQGRCTLVSTIQMYQIMALQCLISSYSLSVLYLDGVKYGDSQMTAMGLLGSVSFMSVSRSKPLDKLSKVRPLTSIFHPALFSSLLGQFAIHLSTMLLAVYNAKTHLPPDYSPDLDGLFQPGILNTVVFLVSSVQQVSVFVVNLQGRPFMTGVTENTPLLWSLVATFILTFMFASETVPGLNRYFQLVAFPEESFRDFILLILVLDLLACFVWDRIMQFLFARDILLASFEGTSFKDVMKLGRTFAIVGFLMYSFLGSSDQWDELLAMEVGENSTNATSLSDDISLSQTVADAVNRTLDPFYEEF